jgi:hypothetical protein
MMEMESCLIEDRKPTLEQVGWWTTLQSQVTQKMLELNADVDQLRRAIDPLFGFDAEAALSLHFHSTDLIASEASLFLRNIQYFRLVVDGRLRAN